VGWPSGNGAKFGMERSGKGMCSGRSGRANLSFPAHFLCHFLLALKESGKRTDPVSAGELDDFVGRS